MDTVLRGLVVYGVLLVIFRLAGRRTMGDMTTFDLVLTLIISETVQEALIDDDHSMTAAFLLICTLVGADIFMSVIKHRHNLVSKLVDSTPVLLVENGVVHEDRLAKERITLDEVLEAARCNHGLERLAQIKHAILEVGGDISIVPRSTPSAAS
jgi:uncharacterized membrane protein YcaP (DUF421 family)